MLTKLPEFEAVVQLLCTSYCLQAWFKGLQPLGNFLVAWCGHELTHDFDIAMLYPQSTFVAITPDDMLAVGHGHSIDMPYLQRPRNSTHLHLCRMPAIRKSESGDSLLLCQVSESS